jgi:hypothetical protein
MKTKNTNTNTTNTTNMFARIANSKGRFFGLYLKNGETLNAQYRNQTDAYLTVYDRTSKMTRKFRKTSVSRATV